MAILSELPGSRVYSLGSRCVIGRGSKADLRIEEQFVSREHASIYFLHGIWLIHDLGSRNGTSLNGHRLESGSKALLREDDIVCFGSTRSAWKMDTATPPGASAQRSDGMRLHGVGGVLWLPNREEAEACLVCEQGRWFLERERGRVAVHNGELVQIAGETWTLDLPLGDGIDLQQGADPTEDVFTEQEQQLIFRVAQDEEHVQVLFEINGTTFDLGARAHNYCLLLLARARLTDHTRGETNLSAGWLYADDLARQLAVDRPTVNLHIFRARRALKRRLRRDIELIERREDSGQLRLSIANIRIHRAW